MSFLVQPVSAAAVRSLRHRVLRAGQPPETVLWPHDDAPETLHAAAFEERSLVAVGTIHLEPPPARLPERGARSSTWRLRGMATEPGKRGQGYGAAVARACVEHARARSGTLVWCNARIEAASFYERLGFVAYGERFDLPGTGAHYAMSLALCPAA